MLGGSRTSKEDYGGEIVERSKGGNEEREEERRKKEEKKKNKEDIWRAMEGSQNQQGKKTRRREDK